MVTRVTRGGGIRGRTTGGYVASILCLAALGACEAQPPPPDPQAALIAKGRDIFFNETIEGAVPNPLEFPSGCKFHPRCPFSTDHCELHEPELLDLGGGHLSACWLTDPSGPMYDPEKVS